jgi:hypothetical protein
VCYTCISSHCCFNSSDRFSCVLHIYKFTLLLQQFWQVSCLLHTYISSHCCFNSSDRFPVCYTYISSHCCFNSSDRFPVCYTYIISHCCFNSSDRFPVCYTYISLHYYISLIPKTRVRNKSLPSLNMPLSDEVPPKPGIRQETSHKLTYAHWTTLNVPFAVHGNVKHNQDWFLKIYPAQNCVCVPIRRSGDSVLCARMERRRVTAEGRICICETTSTKIHTTGVYRLEVYYRCAHWKKTRACTCLEPQDWYLLLFQDDEHYFYFSVYCSWGFFWILPPPPPPPNCDVARSYKYCCLNELQYRILTSSMKSSWVFVAVFCVGCR